MLHFKQQTNVLIPYCLFSLVSLEAVRLSTLFIESEENYSLRSFYLNMTFPKVNEFEPMPTHSLIRLHRN